MIRLKTTKEIKILREGGKILAKILRQVSAKVKPGVSTFELDFMAEDLIRRSGGRPAFKNYGKPAFPATLCTSINEELVHGIPSKKRILKNGEIISLDIGMQYPAVGGLYTDMAVTLPVGEISEKAKKLIKVTKEALDLVADNLRPKIDLQLISGKIQKHIESRGFGVIRDMVGHGVGHRVHEDPQVPNYIIPNFHLRLKPGMVLAFEPMVSLGSYELKTDPADRWTVFSIDGSLTAHFEHTYAVTETGCEILTRD